MNDKSIVLKAFNNQLGELSNDLLLIFPNNKDIKINNSMLETIRKTNPRMVITVWYKYVTCKYANEINNDNFDFFINKDYKSDFDSDEETNTKYLGIIDTLRSEVRNMSDNDKTKTMQYLKNLVKLSTVYHA